MGMNGKHVTAGRVLSELAILILFWPTIVFLILLAFPIGWDAFFLEFGTLGIVQIVWLFFLTEPKGIFL